MAGSIEIGRYFCTRLAYSYLKMEIILDIFSLSGKTQVYTTHIDYGIFAS